ncbi:MAG: metal-dependent transcriptional regulator [Elusimicrobia bacterium]|nr:metal-dependent transcriptional regulator [Elusimicrobiota bacterium]
MTETQKYPMPTAEREDVEESLGLLWHKREGGVTDAAGLRSALIAAGSPEGFDRLLRHGFIQEVSGRTIMTPTGDELARNVVRRLRLAERLLTDVLLIDRNAVDPNACVLEHSISPEVTESICTLLGHPAECPHGLSIPPGACCGRNDGHLSPIVTPLSRLAAGERGRVAYLQLKDHPELHRLLSLGVIPGAPLHLHQTFPAFVVEVGESQLALESAIAARIFVRRAEGPLIS